MMKRVLQVVTQLIIVLTSTLVLGQTVITPLNPPDLLLSKPQLQTLVAWFIVRPGLNGGTNWYNPFGPAGALTGFSNTVTSGWRPTTRPGGFGHLAFDGSNDVITVPNDNKFDFRTGSNFTYTIFINTSSASSQRTIFNKGLDATNPQGYRLEFRSGKLRWIMKDNSLNEISIETTGTFNSGTWRSVAVRYSGGLTDTTLSIFVDAVQAATTTISAGPMTDAIHTGATGLLLISPTDNPYSGSLDDFRIYADLLPPEMLMSIAKGEPPQTYSQQPFVFYSLATAARVRQERKMQ